MKNIRLHTNGNTWKYTLDIFRLRIVFKRNFPVDSLGRKVPHIDISF